MVVAAGQPDGLSLETLLLLAVSAAVLGVLAVIPIVLTLRAKAVARRQHQAPDAAPRNPDASPNRRPFFRGAGREPRMPIVLRVGRESRTVQVSPSDTLGNVINKHFDGLSVKVAAADGFVLGDTHRSLQAYNLIAGDTLHCSVLGPKGAPASRVPAILLMHATLVVVSVLFLVFVSTTDIPGLTTSFRSGVIILAGSSLSFAVMQLLVFNSSDGGASDGLRARPNAPWQFTADEADPNGSPAVAGPPRHRPVLQPQQISSSQSPLSARERQQRRAHHANSRKETSSPPGVARSPQSRPRSAPAHRRRSSSESKVLSARPSTPPGAVRVIAANPVTEGSRAPQVASPVARFSPLHAGTPPVPSPLELPSKSSVPLRSVSAGEAESPSAAVDGFAVRRRSSQGQRQRRPTLLRAVSDDDTTTITLRFKVGEEDLQVEVCPTTTLSSLKTRVFRRQLEEGRRVRIIKGGFVLHDDDGRSLEALGIADGAVLHASVSAGPTAHGGAGEGSDDMGGARVLRVGQHWFSVLLTLVVALWLAFINTGGRAFSPLACTVLALLTGATLHALVMSFVH